MFETEIKMHENIILCFWGFLKVENVSIFSKSAFHIAFKMVVMLTNDIFSWIENMVKHY